MITVEQLELGISDYLDTELVPKLPPNTWQKVIICTALSIGVKKMSKFIDELKQMPLLNAVELIDDNGNIDIDTLVNELKLQIPDSGFSMSNNKLGSYQLTFHKDDVDTLYQCIKRRAPQCTIQQTQTYQPTIAQSIIPHPSLTQPNIG